MKHKPVKSKMSAGFALKDALRKYADGGAVQLPASPVRSLRPRPAQVDAAVDAAVGGRDPNAAVGAVQRGLPMPQAAQPSGIPDAPSSGFF